MENEDYCESEAQSMVPMNTCLHMTHFQAILKQVILHIKITYAGICPLGPNTFFRSKGGGAQRSLKPSRNHGAPIPPPPVYASEPCNQ